MRVEFDLTRLDISRPALEQGLEQIGLRFKMDWRIAYNDVVKKMAIMVSRTDHCLYDLLLRHHSGELRVEIPLIISNHESLAPIARNFNIPFYYIPITAANKQVQEQNEIELFKQAGIDFIVLARYMQIISPMFLSHYPSRIINIHHGFLPAFTGDKPYHKAYERGVKIIGATSHYVTEILDDGPIIEQDIIRVTHRDNVEDLIRKGRDLERIVLARAILSHIEDRIIISGRRTFVAN
jgi:formyltetrahydrofolate deformylase